MTSPPPLMHVVSPIRATTLPPCATRQKGKCLFPSRVDHAAPPPGPNRGTTTVSRPQFPLPRSPMSTASCGYKGHVQGQELLPFASPPRSHALQRSSSHCANADRHTPITGPPPVSSTSPSLGQPSTNTFLHEKMPRTKATAAFPWPSSASRHQASPVVLLLHRRHPNDCPCPGHLPEP
jgi:hypothetical protein